MLKNILKIEDLSVIFEVPIKKEGKLFSSYNNLYALNHINFNLKEGEVLGIVGESGCGKSTLVRAILQLTEGKVKGKVEYNGIDISKLSEKELKKYRKDMQIIFQDPLASLNPKMLIKDIIAEPLKVFYPELSKQERMEKVFHIMEKVGLNKNVANRYPHEFSGGQCQRVGIARAMILNPKILICDEAVSALDVSIKAQIINLILELKEEFNMSILFISHDLSVVKYISDRILVFYLGFLIEIGESEDIYNNPMHPYTEALISAVPTVEETDSKRIILKGDIPSPLSITKGCPFASRCIYKQEKCDNEKPILNNLQKNHSVACFFPLNK